MDVDHLLDLLDFRRINREVALPHVFARNTYHLPALIPADHREFNFLITSYVQHHRRTVGDGTVSDASAFGEAKGILDHTFDQDPYQEGYAAALQIAFDGTNGGMSAVLNEISQAMMNRAVKSYMDQVFNEFVNVLSKRDNLELSRAFFRRFAEPLRRFGLTIDEETLAYNTRAALDYHRRMIEQLIGIARKV
jgi:hypothetical protein